MNRFSFGAFRRELKSYHAQTAPIDAAKTALMLVLRKPIPVQSVSQFLRNAPSVHPTGRRQE
jgi:hypothetical protein